MERIERLDIHGLAHINGNLYNVETVRKTIIFALDDETKDDIIGNILEIFGIDEGELE